MQDYKSKLSESAQSQAEVSIMSPSESHHVYDQYLFHRVQIGKRYTGTEDGNVGGHDDGGRKGKAEIGAREVLDGRAAVAIVL